jgi:predicted Zn-dependent protease
VPPLADSLYQAGVSFYRAKKLDEAISILRQAVASNPNHVAANQLLTEILLTQNKMSEARELLEKLYKH